MFFVIHKAAPQCRSISLPAYCLIFLASIFIDLSSQDSDMSLQSTPEATVVPQSLMACLER